MHENMANGMLTTVDNPYNPIEQYDQWNEWDMQRYNTNQYLARVCIDSHSLSTSEQDAAYIQAMLEIVENNPTLYKIVI